MKGEWVCEKLMRNWLFFGLKSLQKSVYVPCSEKMRIHFFVNKSGGGGGGGLSMEEGERGDFERD